MCSDFTSDARKRSYRILWVNVIHFSKFFWIFQVDEGLNASHRIREALNDEYTMDISKSTGIYDTYKKIGHYSKKQNDYSYQKSNVKVQYDNQPTEYDYLGHAIQKRATDVCFYVSPIHHIFCFRPFMHWEWILNHI